MQPLFIPAYMPSDVLANNASCIEYIGKQSFSNGQMSNRRKLTPMTLPF